MRRTLAGALAIVAGLGLVGACGDADSPAATPDSGSDTGNEAGGGHEGASPVADGARHIAVSGRSFAFDPEEMTVRAGEDIAIAFSSEDSLHDFTVDELDAHVAAEAGSTSTGGFRADDVGRYTFYCSVEGHREAGMEGTLLVED